ncbi:hypothetical protein FO519_005786 [Halicephalobus sp. NKZ332]|nr:hypothetical protein FO519_005786 [Halicephalobus sp. NKZ332]
MYDKAPTNGNLNQVDLRSDTVTRACPEMRRRMAEAIVGDDVYSEDPTVNALQERCAELFKKEAGLFVTTGTMGNLISIMAHTGGRGEIILGVTNHIHRWEASGYARIAGVSATTLPVKPDGTISLEEIEEFCHDEELHQAKTKLICIENTQNFVGGKAITLEYMKEIRKIADKHQMKVHIDGARIFNAAVKLGVHVSELAKDADSIQVCFSKGLGAPIGTMVLGSKEFIHEARLMRKLVGGAWRQAGHLAAAAMYALDHAVEWITKDHERALRLAKAINALNNPKISVEEEGITNMIIIDCKDPDKVCSDLANLGILMMPRDSRKIRAVVHRNIDDEAIDRAIDAFKQLFAK